MKLFTSTHAAWYGATLSTLVFIGNFVKWLRSGPRIRVSAGTGMSGYVDNMRLPGDYIHLSAVNIGDKKTTLTHVVVTQYKRRLSKVLRRKPNQTAFIMKVIGKQQLPLAVEPGDSWAVALEQDTKISEWITKGTVYIGVRDDVTRKVSECRLQER